MNINLTVPWLIEYLESINQVEIWLVSEIDLSSLDLLLKVANFLEGVDELIFLIERKDWLSGWRESSRVKSNWAIWVNYNSSTWGNFNNSWNIW